MERTDPRILKLLFAVMAYVDSNKQAANPFVKGFSRVEQDKDLAYKDMVFALEGCSDYYPEVEQMLEEILSEISSKDQSEKPNDQLDTIS